MPRTSKSGTRGLVKHHSQQCRRQSLDARLTACGCAWYARYGGREVHLARWCGQKVDPHDVGAARKVFTRVAAAIDDKTFDPAGEHKTLTSGQTFRDYIEDWWRDELEKRDLPPELDKHPLPAVENVIARSALGRTALHDLATEPIEAWLLAERRARKWSKKTYNEYRRLLQRFLERAVVRRKIKFNPVRAIEPLKGVNDHRGEYRHFRLDEDVEEQLFAVVSQLNRPLGRPNKPTKLTQEKADALRAAAGRGVNRAQLAATYGVSLPTVCQVLAGKIWNGDRPIMCTTKGDEMERRLIGVFDMGPRAGEMQKIQLHHVDWKRPKKLVDATTGKEFNGYEIALPPENTKTGKADGETQYLYAGTLRASRMLEQRRFQLKGNPPSQTYIFGTERGYYVASFDKSWHALFDLAGIKWGRTLGVVWHTTRAEFASRVCENEQDPTVAKEMCRHKRIETTMRHYIRTRRERRWTAAHNLNR